jgi:uncharacterized phage-associated protein
MRLRFDEKKTTQAAARLLNLAGGQLPYIKLVKLLYLVDREALLRWSTPVTGDHYYSMKMGPVLSNVLDLVTKESHGFWADHIVKASRWDVKLAQDPGDGELSEAEDELIEKIFADYGGMDKFKLVDHLHEILPEWERVTTGRKPIEFASILKAGNKSDEEIAAIESELQAVDLVHAMFGAR